MFDPATTSKSPRPNTTDCWRRPKRCTVTGCLVAVVLAHTSETPRPFAFTTRLVRSSRSAASQALIRRSRIRKPVRWNLPGSSVTRPSRPFVQPKMNTPAESVSQLSLFAMAKSAELSSTVSLPRKSTSVKPGIASPMCLRVAAIRCSQSPTDRPRSCGEKTLARLAVSGRWSASVGPPIQCTRLKCPPVVSRPDAECEPVRPIVTCINSTTTANSTPSPTRLASKSASPLAITRPSESAVRSTAAAKTNTSSSRSTVGVRGSSTRRNKHFSANRRNG
ncbi:hypothetical protein Mal65_17020 [Crateriforma conspicua]|nr:hypothetical protein Mal65_17020 [Crateriforma conspicua]